MDISKIDKIALFAEVFGGTQEFAADFFKCDGVITVTEYIDDRLAAMASLIQICSNGKKGFYIYGVCVAESMRGRGLFRKIMKSAEDKAILLGADFVCLIPASDSLAKKYFEFGYNIEVLPFEREKTGNIFLLSEDFKAFVLFEEEDNSGICGLLKMLNNESPFDAEILRFGDQMGDV